MKGGGVKEGESNMLGLRVATLAPGDFFGEAALVTRAEGSRFRNATVVATTNSVVLVLSKKVF